MKPIVDATSTPLSSIFGSGFLIIVPILAGAVGPLRAQKPPPIWRGLAAAVHARKPIRIPLKRQLRT